MIKQPLTQTELRALAKRLGGIRELVAPKQRAALESLSDAELLVDLAENPTHVRRPLIDTGAQLYAGFTADVRERLGGKAK